MELQQHKDQHEYTAQQGAPEQSAVQEQRGQLERQEASEIGSLETVSSKKPAQKLQLTVAAGFAAAVAAVMVLPNVTLTETAKLETTAISPYSIEYVVELPENFDNIQIVLSNAVIRKVIKPTEQSFAGEFASLQPETVYTIAVESGESSKKTLTKETVKTSKKAVPPAPESLADGKITSITFERDYSTKILTFHIKIVDPNNFLTDFTARLIEELDNVVTEIPLTTPIDGQQSFSFSDLVSSNYVIEITAISTKTSDHKLISLCNSIRL